MRQGLKQGSATKRHIQQNPPQKYLARRLELSSSLILNLEKSIAQQLYFKQQKASKPEPGDGKETKEIGIHKDLHASASQMKCRPPGSGREIGAATSVAVVSFVATASTVALITSLFGIAGGGLGDYKMHKCCVPLEIFGFTQMTPDLCLPQIPSLTVKITITRYLLESTDETTKPGPNWCFGGLLRVQRVIDAYVTNAVVLAEYSSDLKVAGLEAVAHDSVENCKRTP
ncbi:9731_t:CDS:2 [Paraglomus occultum]|uniref:9731_t:CDS:1 n=1 Tax=Paraglomus occultum TaxID=144539 RepID=A0A9N9C575_9GLOM|nr:9731_t:CDS:2 [Paraglomus occultum]